MFLFLQAEDGIRYLVRSRGLGDVYKRQAEIDRAFEPIVARVNTLPGDLHASRAVRCVNHAPVSYTHLTLPTSDLV